MSGNYVVITSKGQRFPARDKQDAIEIAAAFHVNGKEARVTGPWKRRRR